MADTRLSTDTTPQPTLEATPEKSTETPDPSSNDGGYYPQMPSVVPKEEPEEMPDGQPEERPEEQPEESPDDAPADTSEDITPILLTGEDEKHWWGGVEMHLYELVRARERAKAQAENRAAEKQAKDQTEESKEDQQVGGGGLPGTAVVLAMEEPIYRLTCASVLLSDLAYGALEAGEPPRAMGLHFFAHALTRETDVLYRLYHGKTPHY